MPLTPEANLRLNQLYTQLFVSHFDSLDKLLSLDIAHAVDTGNTITDGQNSSSLGETGFLLNTSDSLFEDRGNFGRRCFIRRCVAANLL